MTVDRLVSSDCRFGWGRSVPNDQAGDRQDGAALLDRRSTHQAEQDAHGLTAHFFDGDIDAGQYGLLVAVLRRIVHPDDREIARHGQAGLRRRLDDTKCLDVIGAYDCCGRRSEAVPSGEDLWGLRDVQASA